MNAITDQQIVQLYKAELSTAIRERFSRPSMDVSAASIEWLISRVSVFVDESAVLHLRVDLPGLALGVAYRKEMWQRRSQNLSLMSRPAASSLARNPSVVKLVRKNPHQLAPHVDGSIRTT